MIQVDYEDLPVITDPREAMQPGAALSTPTAAPTFSAITASAKGMWSAPFAQADVIIEGEYHTPAQEHAYLQPEAGLAYIDEEGRVTVQVAGQWTHEDQEQIAHALALPLDQVRVIYPAIGGAFGGREDMSVQIVLALAAWRLSQRGIHRPVKIIWSREEIDHRAPQAPPLPHPNPLGSDPGRKAGRRRRSNSSLMAGRMPILPPKCWAMPR